MKSKTKIERDLLACFFTRLTPGHLFCVLIGSLDCLSLGTPNLLLPVSGFVYCLVVKEKGVGGL